MRTIRLVGIIIFLAISGVGCAIPVMGGKLYVLGEPQYVLVTNNMKMVGDLYADGNLLATLLPGSSTKAYLPFSVNANVILMFKAFTPGRVYQGQTTRAFYTQAGTNANQYWNVQYVEAPR